MTSTPRTHGTIRRAVTALSIIALAGTLAACSGDTGGSGGDPEAGDCEVRTLLVTNVTGPGSQNGSMSKRGAESAVATINANGGINGCELILDVKDDGSDYTKTLPLVQEAMSEYEYANVTVSDFGGASVTPYLAREGQFGIFAAGTKGGYDPAITPYVFDTAPPSADSARLVAEFAIEQGAKRIAVAVDTTTIGSTILDAVTAVAEANGAEVVASEKVDLSSVNMTPVIQRLQTSNADTVIFNLFGSAAGYFVRDYRASGWDATLVGSSSVQATNLATLVTVEDFEGMIVGGPAVNTLPSLRDGADALQADLMADGGIEAPLSLAAQTHDAITVFAWAANEIGSTDASELTAFLEKNGNVEVPGLAMSSTTNFSSTNHEWLPKEGIAFIEASVLEDGRYAGKRLGLADY